MSGPKYRRLPISSAIPETGGPDGATPEQLERMRDLALELSEAGLNVMFAVSDAADRPAAVIRGEPLRLGVLVGVVALNVASFVPEPGADTCTCAACAQRRSTGAANA